jgi:hypothetical protein
MKPDRTNCVRQKEGRDGRTSPLVRGKTRVPGSPRNLTELEIPRSELLSNEKRHEDRRLLSNSSATLAHARKTYNVLVLNISGGGALVEGPVPAQLWDPVTLVLGDFGAVESIVRWINDRRLGLEFAHETQLIADLTTSTTVLREAASRVSIGRSTGAPREVPGDPSKASAAPRETRHPLIWSGHVWNEQGRTDVRLRNISDRGAMVQTFGPVTTGARVILDLGDAGTVRAVVRWSIGDQAGLAFDRAFDMRKLGQCRPSVTSDTWVKPDYLRDDGDTSPWAARWNRLTVAELRRTAGA